MNKKTKSHFYKGFELIKSEKKGLEWNIYKTMKEKSLVTGEDITLRH